ncbi:hypothetical protein LJR251_001906 [Rhizobium rhizogenes]|uniref:hypothetical protein n=1 Tax=Rhizobium rhizogenes TaxID=359 RepID=UPI003ECC40AF
MIRLHGLFELTGEQLGGVPTGECFVVFDHGGDAPEQLGLEAGCLGGGIRPC